MAVDSQPRLPAPSAPGTGRRAAERLAAVVGSRVEQPRPTGGLRGPHDDDRRIAAIPRDQARARRLLAGQARVARHVVHAHRTAEGAASVPADGHEDIGRAILSCGSPGNRHEWAGGRDRRVRVGAALHRQLNRIGTARRNRRRDHDQCGAESARDLEKNRADVAQTFRSARYIRPAASALRATASLAEAKPRRQARTTTDLTPIRPLPRMRD